MPAKAEITTDRLPAVVEAPSYRKTTGEWVFTIATPKKYEALAKAFIERISDLGVFFFRPCKAEQIDEVLKEDKGRGARGKGPGARVQGQVVDVETLSLLLEMTERNVQLQVDNGLLVRTGRGQYDMLASYVALWKAHKELQRGTADAYNDERLNAMRLRRQRAEVEYLERIGKLVNADRVGRMIETAKAGERQALLNMPKNLAPRLDGLSPTEMEIELNDWVYRHLKTQAEIVIAVEERQGDGETRGRGDKKKKPENKKTEPQRRKVRKGKKKK